MEHDFHQNLLLDALRAPPVPLVSASHANALMGWRGRTSQRKDECLGAVEAEAVISHVDRAAIVQGMAEKVQETAEQAVAVQIIVDIGPDRTAEVIQPTA